MTCEKCKGMGFIPYTENGYTMARPCECREKMLTETRLRASGISAAFHKRTLEGFNTKGNQQLIDAKEKAQQYVDNFVDIEQKIDNSIMFLGVPGTGKTHLSLAIANKLLNDNGVSCLYMPYRETMTELKQLNAKDSKYEYAEKMHKLTTARLLIIDDLFKGTVTEADLNYVFQIVNQRYLNQLPFICSSEKRATDMMQIDDAIASRMLEQAKGRVVLLNDTKLNHRLYG